VGKLLDFLLELSEFVLFGLEEFFRGSNALDLVLFLLALEIGEFPLVNLDELVDVVKFLLDQLQLLVEIWRCLVVLGQFGLIQNFIDGLAELVQLIAVLLVLQFERNDHLLVVLLALPLLRHQLTHSAGLLGRPLHISFIIG
jgi:hypothetical protein